jgi:uncharacterized protein
MELLYIPHLTSRQDKTLEIIVDEVFPELETLTPVRGKVIVQHQGSYLDVSVQAETIVTLTCYRCLQQYNHRLLLNSSEVIWLDPAAAAPYDGPLEKQTDVEDLVESLPPDGHFDGSVWLYEQLCLGIPQRQLCDRNCAGIVPSNEPIVPEPAAKVDRRWGALASLKHQLQEQSDQP